jgi:CHAT domain-containing protein
MNSAGSMMSQKMHTPLFALLLLMLGGMINAPFTLGQSNRELIELHREKLQHLYGSRGLYSKDWPYSGEVSMSDVQDVLKGYRKKVGVMWHLHQHDTLYVMGIRADQTVQQAAFFITSDSLSEMTNFINRQFSMKNKMMTSQIRGAEVEDEEDPDSEKKQAAEQAVMVKVFSELNRMLFPFPNFADSLAHVIIIPTLNLATLPFACFKINNDVDLIDKMSYSIAPSLFELMAMDYLKKKEKEDYYRPIEKEKHALFVSNPVYPKGTKWHFPDLPGAQKEVAQIVRIFDTASYKTTVLEGKNATRNNVLMNLCGYDILYFATHGIADATNPLDGSFLVLSGSNEESAFLTAREIQDIRLKCQLNARLVVLSACQTGLGSTHEAGVIGLARAFQISGADNVLMSLWNIDDRETVKLMGKFMEIYIKENHATPYEALRQSMVWYRDHVKSPPYYWASFSIFGIP